MLFVAQRAQVLVAQSEIDSEPRSKLPGVVNEEVRGILPVVALQKTPGDLHARGGPCDGRAARVGRISGQEIRQGALLRRIGGAGSPGSARAVEGERAARAR